MIIRSHAPTRLGLAGGGTDVAPYCDRYGGRVLNATIDIFANCYLEPIDGDRIEFHAIDLRQSHSEAFSGAVEHCPAAFRLHQAVCNYVARNHGGFPRPFRLTTFSEAPPGSGLGSSSTMVVAILNAFVKWLDLPYGEYDLAHAAYVIERMELAILGGKQDQYSAAFGGINLMEFEANDKVVVNPLRLKNSIVREFEASIMLVHTGLSRESSNIIHEQSSNVSRNEKDSVDALHELKEHAQLMKEALLLGDMPRLADLLNVSWQSKKRTAHSISNSVIDDTFRLALAGGAVAGKVSGAGGGGYIMFMVDPIKRPLVIDVLERAGRKVVCPKLAETGAVAWRVRHGIRN